MSSADVASEPAGAPRRNSRQIPAHGAVAARLRQDIVYCRWVAGQWLKQADLEAHYGASRSEVRGALAEMLRLGLVVHVHNYGYRVTPPDPVKRAEIRATRLALELAAVDPLVERITPADVARLRGIATEFADMAGDRPLHELIDLNHTFHAELYALCGNSFLNELIASLRARGLATSNGRWSTPRGLMETAQEHLAMVDALEARDAEALRTLIRKHVLSF